LAGRAVIGGFGHVDVHAYAVFVREPGGRFERGIAARERCVHPDKPAAAAAQKSVVLLEAPTRTVDAVAVGDAVRAHHAHADLGTGIGDHRQRPFDGRR
jgi:hypothetical protein